MKRNKQRMRRSHLKKYSSTIIGGTSTIDKFYFKEANERAQHTDRFQLWFYGLPLEDDTNSTIANQRRAVVGKPTSNVKSSRELLLSEGMKEHFEKLQKKVDFRHHIVLVDSPRRKLTLLWAPGEYFLMYHDLITKTVQTSIPYGSRERALDRWKTGHVTWIDCISTVPAPE